jgi:HlyD family secretion protein
MRLIVSAAVIAISTMLFPGTALVARSDGNPGGANAPFVAQVVVVRATNACFSATIHVTGYLVARNEAIMALSQGDKVVEVLASPGDRVTADQALVRVERQSPDPAKPGTIKTETVALKSPAAGVVLASTASVGSTIFAPQPEPLFVIAVENEIDLKAEVPSIHVPELSPGQTARVQIRDIRELSGQVRLVPASIDQRTQLGYTRISLENVPELRFGMFARAIINANRSCSISVPNSAVTYLTRGTTVQVVRNNKIETRNIQIGIRSDTDIEVRSGLNEGDLVVANAGTSLRDGDKVKPIDSDSAGTEAR